MWSVWCFPQDPPLPQKTSTLGDGEMWVLLYSKWPQCVCRCAHTCTQLMRRGVEWSTDEALWRMRALESGVWVGSLLSSR